VVFGFFFGFFPFFLLAIFQSPLFNISISSWQSDGEFTCRRRRTGRIDLATVRPQASCSPWWCAWARWHGCLKMDGLASKARTKCGTLVSVFLGLPKKIATDCILSTRPTVPPCPCACVRWRYAWSHSAQCHPLWPTEWGASQDQLGAHCVPRKTSTSVCWPCDVLYLRFLVGQAWPGHLVTPVLQKGQTNAQWVCRGCQLVCVWNSTTLCHQLSLQMALSVSRGAVPPGPALQPRDPKRRCDGEQCAWPARLLFNWWFQMASVDVAGSGNSIVRGTHVQNPWANSNGLTLVVTLMCVFNLDVTWGKASSHLSYCATVPTASRNASSTCWFARSTGSDCGLWLDMKRNVLHKCHNNFQSKLTNLTSLSIVRLRGSLKLQQISRNVRSATASEEHVCVSCGWCDNGLWRAINPSHNPCSILF